ncbi:ketose-bisphosphate aldolase class-II family protein [Zea mays]|uniref:Ketose-bisphosphate aldolase class-II family protein n=1 Tax=Zea mays TaxID=4577 RepID=A0A1D6EEX9_MAIZE|nr:ketose-bisphosphate aldolase class-II family protein [Zea mays]
MSGPRMGTQPDGSHLLGRSKEITHRVGGLEKAYLAAKSLLQAAKICNNMAMAISMLGVSEAFALGQNLGIKATTVTDIFNCSSARCWSRDHDGKVIPEEVATAIVYLKDTIGKEAVQEIIINLSKDRDWFIHDTYMFLQCCICPIFLYFSKCSLYAHLQYSEGKILVEIL